jgi:hypothetical protein
MRLKDNILFTRPKMLVITLTMANFEDKFIKTGPLNI